ncbi:MAG: Zn-dependent alcohol dehydrogenase [Chloroflexi bacterium]|nr:Zn-dependent alcohol dehydrogenase [Chloroflexota bacterium]
MQTRAAVLYEANTPLRVEEVILDDPGYQEVLVKMVGTGVCHSDLGIMKGENPSPFPIVLGHEGAGIVEKVGPGVTLVQPGDHVVLPAIFNCGKCRYCIEGQPALCSEVLPALVSGRLPGGGKHLHKEGEEINIFYTSAFAEYVVVHERTAVKVRDDAPLDVVCLLSCAVSTGVGSVINRARIRAGESIIIYGCGGVGLSAVMGAKLAGAGKLIAVDILDRKLEIATELGADYVINASNEYPQQRIMEITGGGADYAIETTGNVEVMAQAFASIHDAGTCVLVGVAPLGTMLSTPPYQFLFGKTLIGSMLGNVRTKIDVPRYVDLYMEGKLPIDKLISRYYILDDINDACAALERGEVIRSVIRF